MGIVTATPDTVSEAAAILKAGDLVVVPTETVYGLAADATNAEAVEKIFKLKNRPAINPLICHVADQSSAGELVILTPLATKLASVFWPGPLTLVLQKTETCAIAADVSAGLPTLAVRVPSHPVMHAVLKETGLPLAAPSANRSESLSPTEAAHAAESLDDPGLMILDAGRCSAGLESTIVDARGDIPVILRFGAITPEDLKAVAGRVQVAQGDPTAPTSPGQMLKHYAPKKPLRLNAVRKEPDEVFIGFGPVPFADLTLSPGGSLTEAAANLFAVLHEADRRPEPRIAVSPVRENGLGAAINDRLQRAARSTT